MRASIHFYLRTDRPQKDGSAPICLLLSFARNKKLRLTTGKYAPLQKWAKKFTTDYLLGKEPQKRETFYCWNKEKERIIGAGKEGDLINLFLDNEKKKANDIIIKHELLSRPLSIQSFQDQFLKPKGHFTFLQYFETELKKNKKFSITAGTLKTYLTVASKVDKYKPNLTLSDIDYKFLQDFENYMLRPIAEKGLGNCQKTASKTLSILRTLMLIAIRNGDFDKDYYPFKDFRIKHVDVVLTSRHYLEPDEILRIEQLLSPENIHELKPHEIKATKRFLFSCYTGIRFSDMNSLNRKTNIFSKHVLNPQTKRLELRYFIELKMHKVSRPVYIPLIDKALELIDLNSEGRLFDNITNQRQNLYLKNIAVKAKIDKRLTFHVSRHSFATVCFLYGIPEIVGQRLLGHKNRKFTEVYTHLSQNKLFYEMDKLNAGLNQYQISPDDINGSATEVKELLPMLQHLAPDQLNTVREMIKMIRK